MPNSSNPILGPRLRAHRESRGLTLDALAEATKIQRSLLADLERNNLSRWPAGIYGRAFIREYAKALGLPPNEVLEEFRLLSDPGESPVAPGHHTADVNGAAEFRLMLADSPSPARGLYARLLDAARALGIVLAVGYAATIVTGFPYWTASGVVAMIWCPLTTILGGGSSRRILSSARRHHAVFRRVASIVATARDISRRHTRMPARANAFPAEPPLADADVDRLPAESSYIH